MLKKQGIYQIKNKANGHFYYGSTTSSFKKRWHEHKIRLNTGIHENRHLQRAWSKYGADNFEFNIIHICPSNQCLYWEQILLEMWWDNGKRCYINPTAENSFGSKRSEKAKRKMKRAQKKIKIRFGNKWAAKLTTEQITLIKRAEGTQKEIGIRFGIHQSQVSRIKNNLRWSA